LELKSVCFWNVCNSLLHSGDECGIDEFLTQINPTQATWAPTRSLPIDTSPPSPLPLAIDHGHDLDNFTQHPLWYNNRIKSTSTSHAVDKNDGPTSFNNSLSILGGKLTKKRSAKRKLFFE
ncbi:Uncharacterized protein FWK35_00028146, partial [Aphis craccivora]